MLILSPQPVKYRGVITGLRISAVDGGATESGGAFVDALPSAVTDLVVAYPGDLSFEAFDSAGRMLRGVLKAVGSGETYLDLIGGTDPALMNGDFSLGDDGKWAKGPGWSIAGGVGVKAVDASDSNIYQELLTTNCLYKASYTSVATAGQFSMRFGTVTTEARNSGTWTYYRTSNGTTAGVRGYDITVGTVDLVTFKQVLTPSASGATIVSAKGGAVYNFNYKNASFTYNAASYLCIVKALR